jgi:hypothetical protein
MLCTDVVVSQMRYSERYGEILRHLSFVPNTVDRTPLHTTIRRSRSEDQRENEYLRVTLNYLESVLWESHQ